MPPRPPHPARRALLADAARLLALLAASGAWPALAAEVAAAAFEARSPAQVWRALGLAAPAPAPEVTLTAPDIAEDGAAVPMGVAASLSDVRRIVLVVERNPAPLAAVFELGPEVEPAISTFLKMAESSTVWAVVVTDRRVVYARKEVKVTLGGCIA